MAAEAKSPEEKQNIYELHMLYATYVLSRQDEFDLDTFSFFMKNIYANQVHEQGEDNNPEFYKIRNHDLLTDISDFDYSELSIIFMEKIEDIVRSDITSAHTRAHVENFKSKSLAAFNKARHASEEEAKNAYDVYMAANRTAKSIATFNQYLSPNAFLNNVEANANEKRLSQYVHTNINTNHRLKSTIKANRINHPSKPVRTKGAFKYSPNIAGIKLTNRFVNKYMHHKYGTRRNNSFYSSIRKAHEKTGNLHTANASSLENYRKLKSNIYVNPFLKKILQMYTTIPDSGTRIPTTSFGFKSIFMDWARFFGYSVERLTIMHTSPEFIVFLLKKVKEIWSSIIPTLHLTEIMQSAFKIHWLIATATPFSRGSAGFAKVMLNAAIQRAYNLAQHYKLNLAVMPLLKETPQYNRKSDWVALLSPKFENYPTTIINSRNRNGLITITCPMFNVDDKAMSIFNTVEFKRVLYPVLINIYASATGKSKTILHRILENY